jgi:hypothetical protein
LAGGTRTAQVGASSTSYRFITMPNSRVTVLLSFIIRKTSETVNCFVLKAAEEGTANISSAA